MSRVSAIVRSILAVSALAMGGCAQSTAPKEYFMLDVAREAQPVAARSDATVEVRRFSINTAYASRNLVYRLGEVQYEPDFYRQFMISPAIMITEVTRHWLADAGLFKQVLPPGSPAVPTYTLQGLVTALYGDFTDKAAPTAALRIRFFLVRHVDDDDTVVFAQSYRTAGPLPDRTGPALIQAFSKDMAEILTALEADLAKFLAAEEGT